VPYCYLDETLYEGGAFMLTVLARLTLRKTKNKKPSVLLFHGIPYAGTQQKQSENASLDSSSQPTI
jgi:hypothetical protein